MQAPPPTTRRRSRAVATHRSSRSSSIIAIVVVIVSASSGNDDKPKVKTAEHRRASTSGRADHLQRGEGRGHARQVHVAAELRHRRPGLVAIPILNAAPCVPTFTGTTTAARPSPGVTAQHASTSCTTWPKPDPQFDILAKAAGAYDTPEQTIQASRTTSRSSRATHELYGRKIELVDAPRHRQRRPTPPRRAPTPTRPRRAARVRRDRRPSQTKAFADELTSRASCASARA